MSVTRIFSVCNCSLRRDRRREATDAGFDVRAEDDVGDPKREIGLRLEFVDKRNTDHGDNGCTETVSPYSCHFNDLDLQRSKREQSECLKLGLSLHLCVPQNDRRHNDQSHVSNDS
jgi:hypothetical protein